MSREMSRYEAARHLVRNMPGISQREGDRLLYGISSGDILRGHDLQSAVSYGSRIARQELENQVRKDRRK